MKISSFTVILTFVVLMVIGVAVFPLLEIGGDPIPKQGKTITVEYSWPNVSAKVIEQNLTSPIEGMMASLKGVESVASNSYFGSNEIFVNLKENADVSAVRFEISSLLRQMHGRLPKGVSYPSVSGGEIVNTRTSQQEEKLLLTYQVNANMQPEAIKEYLQQHVEKRLLSVERVSKIEITGVMDKYKDVSYNPTVLSACGITADDIVNGIRNFMGQDVIVGTVNHNAIDGNEERISVHFTTEAFEKPLEQMPLKKIGGKMVYLNDLAVVRTRQVDPDSYYRVNGLNTVYVNVFIPADGKLVRMSDRVQEEMEKIKTDIHQKIYFHLSYDSASQQRDEMSKLIGRTLLSLLVLLVFVWLTNRNFKYLLIIATTLVANLLVACIVFVLFHIRLHIYSLAGITVSLGLIIDSTIVMADHYGYYRNKKAFLSILAAMLTTIGSMVVVFFLPKDLQQNLYDFAWVVIVNLAVSLLVALFFVPAIIDKLGFVGRRHHLSHGRWVVKWNCFYRRFITFTSKYKWCCCLLLALLYYAPFHFRVFSDVIEEKGQRQQNVQEEKVLHIAAEMPVGGTAVQLNQKMMMVEELLKRYKGIKKFTTRIDGRRGSIDVEFKKDAVKGSFPYRLENAVIGKVITIGGADWATYGVSERGFSNSLNLQQRSQTLVLSGYNYNQLYRLAENLEDYLGKNSRVRDLVIQTPGYENQEDEFYMKYEKERMAIYGVQAPAVHRVADEMLTPLYVGYYKDRKEGNDVYLTPTTFSSFDLWHMENEQVKAENTNILLSDIMSVKRREAKNVIPKKNQEYVLNVAFNVLGSYTYTEEYLKDVVKHFNKMLPVGYRCQNIFYENPVEESSNYWLLLLVAVVVFFVCAIQFESIRLAWSILSVTPLAVIGAFLTFWMMGVEFGSGGFASLVLLIGIVVNSGIYILSQYRYVCEKSHRGNVVNYVCAYNHKVIPIFLTVSSTIVGLVPFFLDVEEAPFWFSFATGVIGGLLFSIPALVFVMPLFVRFNSSKAKTILIKEQVLTPVNSVLGLTTKIVRRFTCVYKNRNKK